MQKKKGVYGMEKDLYSPSLSGEQFKVNIHFRCILSVRLYLITSPINRLASDYHS